MEERIDSVIESLSKNQVDEIGAYCKYYLLTNNKTLSFSFCKGGKYKGTYASQKVAAVKFSQNKDVIRRMKVEEKLMIEYAKNFLANNGYVIMKDTDYNEQKMARKLKLDYKKSDEEKENDKLKELMYSKDAARFQLAKIASDPDIDKNQQISALKTLADINQYKNQDNDKQIEKPIFYLPLPLCTDCPNRKKLEESVE